MLLKFSKEEELIWTKHSSLKMRQYRLSESRLKRVLRKPDRREAGIAPRTIAVMQITGTKKHQTEIWLMYQKKKKENKLKIISAWRYPARTPEGKMPPIPEDTLWELENENKNSAGDSN